MNNEVDHKDAAEPPLDWRAMPLVAHLRAHASSKRRDHQWDAQARILMRWAADTIDSANEALDAEVAK